MKPARFEDSNEMKTITRIEFEILGGGRFRWNLFADEGTETYRVHSEVSHPETIEAIFQTTALLCTAPDLPGNHDEKQTGLGEETDFLA